MNSFSLRRGRNMPPPPPPPPAPPPPPKQVTTRTDDYHIMRLLSRATDGDQSRPAHIAQPVTGITPASVLHEWREAIERFRRVSRGNYGGNDPGHSLFTLHSRYYWPIMRGGLDVGDSFVARIAYRGEVEHIMLRNPPDDMIWTTVSDRPTMLDFRNPGASTAQVHRVPIDDRTIVWSLR